MTAMGVAIGTVGSILLSHALRSLTFGISSLDPIAVGIAILVVATVGFVASYRPMRKAARINLANILREE
jgi:ABC-type antimicrobial peptide transport system permease subunit